MGRLIYHDKCYTAMRNIKLNENEYATIETKDYWLLNPNIMDTIGSVTKNSYAVASNIEVTQEGTGNIRSSNIRLDNNIYYLCIPYYGNKVYGFLEPISKNCKTIEIDTFVTRNSSAGSYDNSAVIISSDPYPTSIGGYPTEELRCCLTSYNNTSTWINEQPHVTINSTDQYNLSRQVVILDIAGLQLENDVYLGLYSCDCDAYFRSIKICF